MPRIGTLAGRVAIVTGASRGIGRAIAIRLAKEGAHVVLSARHRDLLASAVLEITESTGIEGACLPLDLRTPEAPRQLAEFALQTFGRIDIVVNNAGATKRGEFEELTEEDWTDGYALKFFGAVRLTRATWPHLKAASGSLINISGIGGRTPEAQFTIGGSVNAALISFTKAMAAAGIRDGVQVNVINPGTIRTDRYKNRLAAFAREHGVDTASAEREFVKEHQTTRIGEPEDIAALVAFILSAEARFLHGAMIDMDGGATKTL
jgi:NAD(P)-dependent dehydrogenase (short-subunit alcohol dehydrogenase family)